MRKNKLIFFIYLQSSCQNLWIGRGEVESIADEGVFEVKRKLLRSFILCFFVLKIVTVEDFDKNLEAFAINLINTFQVPIGKEIAVIILKELDAILFEGFNCFIGDSFGSD